MKVSVTYNERTYGNSSRSTASEVYISGTSQKVDMKINFKKPQPGRSWDWMSSASVGGANIEMSLADAKAIAEALLTFAVVCESAKEKHLVDVSLRLRENTQPERTLRYRSFEEALSDLKKQIEGKTEK